MKKFLILICIVAFLISCKKSNPTPTANSDVVGKWTVYSWQESASTGGSDANFNVNVTQFPCLANSVLQINADNTTSTSYIGTDTCYVTPRQGPFDPGTSIGMAGQAPFLATWSRSGNNIYINGQLSVISSSNGKLYLTSTDTITTGLPQTTIVKTVDIKE